jgi:hypothetical protein
VTAAAVRAATGRPRAVRRASGVIPSPTRRASRGCGRLPCCGGAIWRMQGMDRVGFVGLGNMGRPMAANIRRRQFPMAVFDLSPTPVATLVELGAEAAPDVASLARGADVVVTDAARPARGFRHRARPGAGEHPRRLGGAGHVHRGPGNDRRAGRGLRRQGHRLRGRAGGPAGRPCRARREPVHGGRQRGGRGAGAPAAGGDGLHHPSLRAGGFGHADQAGEQLPAPSCCAR